MSYIKKIAKRILAKDYDIVKRSDWMDDCAILLNSNGLRWTMKKRYKHFLYFIIASQKWNCKRGQECCSSTGYIEYLAKLFNIKHSTLKFYLREMVKDKILIGPDNLTFSEEAYWFNKTYFDTYLLTDYKTLEE
jgi:hypothetical protein